MHAEDVRPVFLARPVGDLPLIHDLDLGAEES